MQAIKNLIQLAVDMHNALDEEFGCPYTERERVIRTLVEADPTVVITMGRHDKLEASWAETSTKGGRK